MRGQIRKVPLETQSTLPKQSDEEPPVQVIPNDSPNQLEIPCIPHNPNEKCKAKMNECQNDSQASQ